MAVRPRKRPRTGASARRCAASSGHARASRNPSSVRRSPTPSAPAASPASSSGTVGGVDEHPHEHAVAGRRRERAVGHRLKPLGLAPFPGREGRGEALRGRLEHGRSGRAVDDHRVASAGTREPLPHPDDHRDAEPAGHDRRVAGRRATDQSHARDEGVQLRHVRGPEVVADEHHGIAALRLRVLDAPAIAARGQPRRAAAERADVLGSGCEVRVVERGDRGGVLRARLTTASPAGRSPPVAARPRCRARDRPAISAPVATMSASSARPSARSRAASASSSAAARRQCLPRPGELGRRGPGRRAAAWSRRGGAPGRPPCPVRRAVPSAAARPSARRSDRAAERADDQCGRRRARVLVPDRPLAEV